MTPPTSSPPLFGRRSPAGLHRFRTFLVLLLGSFGLLAGVAAPSALAATGLINITALDPPPPPKPTGAASSYSINFTCSSNDR